MKVQNIKRALCACDRGLDPHDTIAGYFSVPVALEYKLCFIHAKSMH